MSRQAAIEDRRFRLVWKGFNVVFDGFEEFDTAATGTTIHRCCEVVEGPPILLLHGIPETHLVWHRVAPQAEVVELRQLAQRGHIAGACAGLGRLGVAGPASGW
jgi:pimeloyl-ACP methyl ester carboxylesterase